MQRRKKSILFEMLYQRHTIHMKRDVSSVELSFMKLYEMDNNRAIISVLCQERIENVRRGKKL